VSRGERPDLAFVTANQVTPTLLLNGIEMNKMALTNYTQLKKMKIVPGANTF
jgi:hypothetical protein